MEKTQVLSKINNPPPTIVEIGFSGDLNDEHSLTNLHKKLLSPKVLDPLKQSSEMKSLAA
jgi:hypothetical protein